MDERTEELEIKICYLEKQNEELNESLVDLSKKVSSLMVKWKKLRGK